MSLSEGVSIRELIQQFKARSPYKHKLEEASLSHAWKTAMPQAVQKRTAHTFFKQGKWYVRLHSAPLRQELQLNKEKVLALLKQHAPECALEDIVLL